MRTSRYNAWLIKHESVNILRISLECYSLYAGIFFSKDRLNNSLEELQIRTTNYETMPGQLHNARKRFTFRAFIFTSVISRQLSVFVFESREAKWTILQMLKSPAYLENNIFDILYTSPIKNFSLFSIRV